MTAGAPSSSSGGWRSRRSDHRIRGGALAVGRAAICLRPPSAIARRHSGGSFFPVIRSRMVAHWEQSGEWRRPDQPVTAVRCAVGAGGFEPPTSSASRKRSPPEPRTFGLVHVGKRQRENMGRVPLRFAPLTNGMNENYRSAALILERTTGFEPATPTLARWLM
jgi:hypothetical protein